MPLARRSRPVHPRACGEQSSRRTRSINTIGSSPRLRGTATLVHHRLQPVRFIPAPAGNRIWAPSADSSVPVHPRACGEQPVLVGEAGPELGSSPRLRGTAEIGERTNTLIRFIPAPAGNRSSRRALETIRSVHPRACGEQRVTHDLGPLKIGSSPRLRGTVPSIHRPREGLRFIPAPAGNSPPYPPRGISMAVHPRACGEQEFVGGSPNHYNGSSPRLRGTGRVAHRSDRFIPAPAGNSCSKRGSSSRVTVHPRACGEQISKQNQRALVIGSSPRLRGTGLRFGGRRRYDRFIPAPAGNSSRQPASFTLSTVHPRACGEQFKPVSYAHGNSGSSPRLRGTGLIPVADSVQYRFIPAPAGNSKVVGKSPRFVPVHPRACGEQTINDGGFTFAAGSSPRLRGTASLHWRS